MVASGESELYCLPEPLALTGRVESLVSEPQFEEDLAFLLVAWRRMVTGG